jgi:hypothetical protein
MLTIGFLSAPFYYGRLPYHHLLQLTNQGIASPGAYVASELGASLVQVPKLSYYYYCWPRHWVRLRGSILWPFFCLLGSQYSRHLSSQETSAETSETSEVGVVQTCCGHRKLSRLLLALVRPHAGASTSANMLTTTGNECRDEPGLVSLGYLEWVRLCLEGREGRGKGLHWTSVAGMLSTLKQHTACVSCVWAKLHGSMYCASSLIVHRALQEGRYRKYETSEVGRGGFAGSVHAFEQW